MITHATKPTMSLRFQVMEDLIRGLGYLPGLRYEKDVSYVEFLNRVQDGEMKLRSQGLWDVPHPWLNLFVPRSRISDLKIHVLDNIILKNKITTGTALFYPLNKSKYGMSTCFRGITYSLLNMKTFPNRSVFTGGTIRLLRLYPTRTTCFIRWSSYNQADSTTGNASTPSTRRFCARVRKRN